MPDLTNYPLTIIFVASIAAFFLAIESGHHIGSKVEEGANVLTLEAAALGLLALMIGFTFSGSSPSRWGRCRPHPSQTRTSGIPASGSSRVRFARGGVSVGDLG